MTQIKEGYLAFEFGHRWRVFKLDDHRDYRKRIGKLEETKAVDFLGILDENELYFIEVKDFREHRIENRDRILKGELAIEVAQKVRDTLACIIGAYRTSSSPDFWQLYARLLCDTNVRINVVLWLEHDLPSHPQQREKTRASVRGNVFKQKLNWLTGQVFVHGLDIQGLPDTQVRNLPRT